MHADIAERRRVWLALSDMFLDTDTALSRAWRVSELARSPYSLAELEDISRCAARSGRGSPFLR
jgi:hypothetical protein